MLVTMQKPTSSVTERMAMWSCSIKGEVTDPETPTEETAYHKEERIQIVRCLRSNMFTV